MQNRKTLAGLLSLVLLFSVMLSGNLTVQAADITIQDLILHCKFDGDIEDSSNFRNQTQAVGNISYVDGIIGKGAKFDGQSYIEVDCQESFNVLSGGYTFSVWLYKEEIRPLREQPILQKIGNPDEEDPSFILADNDYQPYIQIFSQDENHDSIYGTKIDMQKWTLLTVTYDLNNVKFYENGVLKANKQAKGTVPITTGNVQIGFDGYDGSSFFKGVMDDLRVYSKVLTPEQVKAIFDAGTAGSGGKLVNPPNSQVAYYSFDGNIMDTSGFNNNGYIIGNISFVDAMKGKGAKFNGESYIQVNDSDSLDLTKSYTFSLWMYKEDIGEKREQPILLKLGNSVDIEQASYMLSDNDFLPYVQVYTIDGNYDGEYVDIAFEKLKWAMLTVSYDGKNIRYYKNGTLIGSKECLGSIPASSGKLLIGFNEYDGSSFFKGIMDELRIYNYVLTPEQVKSLYNPTTTTPAITLGAPSTWATAEIDKAKELKLTTDKILSKYQTNITREEFCELAVKLYEALSGKNAEAAASNPFVDTTNSEVLKAYGLKIVNGVSADKFAPSNTVTRQEISTMLIRTLLAAKPGFVAATNEDLTFVDETDIAVWAKEPVKFLNANGIMKGSGSDTISIMPKGNTSREQAVILVKRTFENFSRYIWINRPEGGGEWKVRPEGGGEW
ncbi:MAG: Ig-like protein [Clostridia bacterium]|jgi:hypothetical protein|nr:Ig-like protein [Clostridia bacterium]